jgi:hypothetical protein
MPQSDISRLRTPQEIEQEMSLETNLQRMIHLAQELLRALDAQGSKAAGDTFR